MAETKRVSKMWETKPALSTLKDVELTKDNLISYLLALTEDDITYSFMMELFGGFGNKGSLCNPYDTFVVPVGAYSFDRKGKKVSNKNKFTTTIGLWVYNVYFFRDDGLADIVDGYVDFTINDKKYKSIDQKLSWALLEDRISSEQFRRYMEKTQFMMPFEAILSPNQTEKMLTCTKVMNKKKQELYQKYKKDIDAEILLLQKRWRKSCLHLLQNI